MCAHFSFHFLVALPYIFSGGDFSLKRRVASFSRLNAAPGRHASHVRDVALSHTAARKPTTDWFSICAAVTVAGGCTAAVWAGCHQGGAGGAPAGAGPWRGWSWAPHTSRGPLLHSINAPVPQQGVRCRRSRETRIFYQEAGASHSAGVSLPGRHLLRPPACTTGPII